jgi:hypothetical protein
MRENVLRTAGPLFVYYDVCGYYYCPTKTIVMSDFRCDSLKEFQAQIAVQIGGDGQIKVIESVVTNEGSS